LRRRCIITKKSHHQQANKNQPLIHGATGCGCGGERRCPFLLPLHLFALDGAALVKHSQSTTYHYTCTIEGRRRDITRRWMCLAARSDER
jgi:hypothetical protein